MGDLQQPGQKGGAGMRKIHPLPVFQPAGGRGGAVWPDETTPLLIQ